MAPPPITPSPHRFLTSQPSNPTPKPPSSLRFQQNATQTSSSQRFVSTPKFNFSSTQKPTSDQAKPTPQYSSPLSRRPHLAPIWPAQKKEDIEETSSDREDDTLDNDHDSNIALPIQRSKRRRPGSLATDTEAILISSPTPSPTSPPTTPPHPTIEQAEEEEAEANYVNLAPQPFHTTTPAPDHPPRFILPPPLPLPSSTTPTIPSRPPLLLPPRPSTPPPPPTLPAFFSPQRRGQKYISGGLASTVRDWVVEMGQAAHYHQYARRGTEGGGMGWDFRFGVVECGGEGAGVLLVVGGEGERWVLVGRGRGRGDEEGSVGRGRMVGVREPVWEVEVGVGVGVGGEEGRERWRVAVEWEVLG